MNDLKNGQDCKYLDEKLAAYAQSGYYPFHMPGHKRNMAGLEHPYEIDITEIDGFDNLHHAENILLQAQGRLSELFHSKRSYYLVNGSTCGLLSAIGAVTGYGDKILIARNCHKSVYNAVKLFGLKSCYVYPRFLQGGVQGHIHPADLEHVLAKEGQVAAIVITSPTYEGIVSDIRKISDIAHKYHANLIIDEAHGAHFSLSEFFPESAVRCGADLVIQSLHKTLPCLTQSAVLHITGDRVDVSRVEEMLGIFQTSSPSYVLMAGIDRCVRLLEQSGEQLFYGFHRRLDDFYVESRKLKRLRVFCKQDFEKYGVYDVDQSKIIISTLGTGIDGTHLYRKLLELYRLQMELYSANYVLAMTSIMDTEEGFCRLTQALVELDLALASRMEYSEQESKRGTKLDFEYEMNFIQMAYAKREKIMELSDMNKACVQNNLVHTEWKDCIGKVCGEYIYLYPPGIPMIVPGELITQDFINVLDICSRHGLQVQGTKDRTYRKILTVACT